MQFSYNNFDCKYMHKTQLLLLLYTYFCVDGLLTVFKDPKTRKRVKYVSGKKKNLSIICLI